MRVCWDVLALGLLSASAWAEIVPVSVRQSRSRLEARGAPQSAELLRPTHEIELLYADEAAIGPPGLVTVTAKHDSRPYVLLERFEDMLSSITCSTRSAGNSSTVISMTFRDKQFLVLAEQEWSRKGELTFVTHHDTCNHDVKQREVYRCYSIRFDHTTNVVIVACDRKEFGYTTEANTAIRIRGGTAPRHLARRLSPRTLGKKRSSPEKRAPRSFAFSLDQDWAEVEEWDLIPGMLGARCLNCSYSGGVNIGWDFNITPENLLSLKDPLDQGKPDKPIFDAAKMTLEVTKPIESRSNLEVISHGGLSIRWPGLMRKTSDKKVLGDRVLRDGEDLLFTIGGLQFFKWWGLGFLAIGWIGGAFEMMHESTLTIPAGQSATMDLMDSAGNSGSFKPRRDARTRVTKAEAAIAAEVAYGFAIDITVKVKLPDMNWNALRNGGGRGPIGYKDGQLTWYGGVFGDGPGIGITVSPDEKCRRSKTSWPLRAITKLIVGISPYASYTIGMPGKVIPRIDAFPIRPGPPLYNTWTLDDRCLLGGSGAKSPTFSINRDMRFPTYPVTLPSGDGSIDRQPFNLEGVEHDKQPPSKQRVNRPTSSPEDSKPLNGQSSSKGDEYLTPSWSVHLSDDAR